MRLPFSLLALVASATAQYRYVFGPTWGLHNAKSHIVYAETTLFPGATPNPQQARLALWAGMDTSRGDLVQAIIVSSPEYKKTCKTKDGEWCIFASVLSDDQQRMGKYSPLKPTDGVNVKYMYDGSTRKYDQTVSVNGQVVSKMSFASGLAKSFYTEVECQDKCHGVVSAHKYVNTTVILDTAEPNFAARPLKNRTSVRSVHTPDRGRTWTVPLIEVEQSAY